MAQGHFHEHHGRFALHLRLALELFLGALKHAEHHVRDGPKAAALDEHGLLVKHFTGNHRLADGGEHRGIGQVLFDQLQTHQPVVHAGETRPGEVDHVHLKARLACGISLPAHVFSRHPIPQAKGEIVHERADQCFRLAMQVKRAVDQIHADDPQRFLFADVFLVEQADVDDDFRRTIAWPGLETHAEPAVAFLLPGEAVRGDRVREHEEGAFVAARLIEALAEQIEFIIQHRLQPLAADVAIGGAVNRVADRHVVSGNGFGHGARRTADAEKAACDFLARADFGERAVFAGVQVDLQRFLVRVQFAGGHDCA